LKRKKIRYGVLAGLITCFAVIVAFQPLRNSYAFSGCEEGCQKCHSLSDQEIRLILEKLKAQDAKILKTQMSPVRGLWEVVIENKGQPAILYVDFSKKYIVSGSIVEVNASLNKTKERLDELLKDKKIRPASVPLKDALVLGSNSAPKKVIVFTDPDCPFCARLHQEIKKVVAQRRDIAFYLKLYPLKGHQDAYWKSRSIVCERSLKLLEDNFEKKPIQKMDCPSTEVDNTMKFAEKNGISGTPTMILPDGSLYLGQIEADKLIKLIDETSAKASPARKKKKN
jgi:thiol:disulfide interchange protein DsbC